jgi:glycerol-3-phosphate dehydrogenase (NAD(P)+)
LALEAARGVPTASVAASQNRDAAREAQRLFAGQAQPTFRVYTGRDIIGAELGGAIKNALAIGAGICDGMGFGDNAKAALLTRGLAEAVRLGVKMGAQAQTFMGLSGVGDLFATANSRLSRNYRVGYALGQGKRLAAILESLGQVAEGVPTTRALCELATRQGVEMPICETLHAALFADRSASEAIRNLMARPLREEHEP